METMTNTRPRQLLGRWISIAIVAAAVVLGLAVLYQANYYPRTEDAAELGHGGRGADEARNHKHGATTRSAHCGSRCGAPAPPLWYPEPG